VLDSTWFDYPKPLVDSSTGRVVEVRCVLARETARSRYYARAQARHPGHLDRARDEDELWGEPSHPLGVGATIEVDTTGPVDAAFVAEQVLSAADASARQGSIWAAQGCSYTSCSMRSKMSASVSCCHCGSSSQSAT